MQFRKETIVNQQYKTIFLGLKELSVQSRKIIQSNIDRITLTNDLNKSTLPVESGKVFTDILVIEYFLKEKTTIEKLLSEIDEIIPKYIVHVLRYKEDAKLYIAYKEYSATKKINIIKFYSTEWCHYNNVNLLLNGDNLDTIFNGFIEQISGGEIKTEEKLSIKEAIEKNIDKENILKQIEQIKKKMRNEKQINKRYALRDKLIDLQNKLEQI